MQLSSILAAMLGLCAFNNGRAQNPAEVQAGVLVVAGTASFTNQAAFKYAPPGAAERFTINLGKYLAGKKKQGQFLFYSDTAAFGVSFERALTAAGHTVTRTIKPPSLSSYDAVFVAGDNDNISRERLTAYFKAGGRVYLVGSTGEGEDETSFWNSFLAQFGLELVKIDSLDPFLARTFGDSPLFDGVPALYVKQASHINLVPRPIGISVKPRILAHEEDLNVLVLYTTQAPSKGAQAPDEIHPMLNPQNGHYYQAVAVEGSLKWSEANDAAKKLEFKGVRGHLVTITSAAENRFVIENFQRAVTGAYWIGAYKDPNDPDYKKPAGAWRWVTGEPWQYTNWAPDEPNGDYGALNSDHIQLWGAGQWNDAPNDQRAAPARGYVVEFDVKR